MNTMIIIWLLILSCYYAVLLSNSYNFQILIT